MSDLHKQLKILVRETCKHPPGSRERQKGLTQLISLIGSHLWREQKAYYEDALQQTWIYFCQNLCEAKTGKAYDASKASLITWLNAYLKRRLQDCYLSQQQQKNNKAAIIIFGNQAIDLLDNLPANPDIPPLLSELKKWAEEDAENKLRRTYIQGHREVNCQVLILRRLPPETTWQELAEEFGISAGTLSSFYQRHCLPFLREFGESEGYL